MLFNGAQLEALAVGEVAIPRPNHKDLIFTVRAIMHGDEKKGERLFPDPEAPTEFAVDGKKHPLRDPVSGAVITEKNFSNPAFLAEAEIADRLQIVVLVVDSLDQDTKLTWTTKEKVGTVAFYKECDVEIKAAGLGMGDLRMILNKALELGNLDGKALERAAEAFSRRDQQTQA